MITEEQNKYEEWLTTIANTRLLFNTIEELEDYLDNHSIHSNGIKRSIVGQAKLRAVFRDLKIEAALITNGIVNLDKMLMHYKRAWDFYRENLFRRSNPSEIVLELLRFCYPPYQTEGLGKKKYSIYKEVVEQNINIPFLILMIMKIIPGYDSKEGDAVDIAHNYEKAMELMEKFTDGVTLFSILPSITRARGEVRKTRFMLLYHISQILDTYESYIDMNSLYATSTDAKDASVELDIDGYWNECNGKLLYTDFWQIEHALNYGSYFFTHWHKDANGNLTGIRYAAFLFEAPDGRLILYMLHPEAIKHRMEGKRYGDKDYVWYVTDMPTDSDPAKLNFKRYMASSVWNLNYNLTKVVNNEVISHYNKWFQQCNVQKKFRELEYEFQPNIYAITSTDIYIPAETDGEYFKIPRDAIDGIEQIQLNDNVGLMTMNNRTFIVFDELSLYILITKNELRKYGIEKVNYIT